MIPINELRINNYVYYNNEHNEIGIITKLVTELITDINYVGINNRIDVHYLNKHINPIPITEEWLFKFGFKDRSGTLKNKMSYGIEIGKMEIAWYRQDNKTRFQTIENGFILKYVNYVHELQNLYYAITKEELILNNK